MAKYLNVYLNTGTQKKRGLITIRQIFEHKRGVSPLIATILLLAFAVALATVIVQLEPFSRCKGDEVFLDTSQSCYNSNTKTIKIWVETKEIPVSGFRINAKGTLDVAPEYNSAQDIKVAAPAVITVPYDERTHGPVAQVNVVAKLNRSNSIMECPLTAKLVQLRPCP